MTQETETEQMDVPVIYADLSWPVEGRPPEVMLSFDGLNPPQQLWADLTALGWSVPPSPPPPGSAISWVPDPVAGTDYTISSWTVHEFRLGSGEWAPDQRQTVSDQTIEVLHRQGVQMSGLPSHIAAALTGSTAETVEPDIQRSGIVISVDPVAPEAESAPGTQTWLGISGREKRSCTWVEHSNSIPDADALTSLYERHGQAWMADGAVPDATTESSTALRIIAPGPAATESKVGKLAKMLGDNVSVIALTPLSAEHGEQAVLVCGSVATQMSELVISNVRLRHPKVIIRIGT